ncbi:fatty acyl-CoA reductase [Noviherbaspirillum denitrificans]|uniref:Dehydrogenase n=1 Tax=Noviherbaspirillum denitrificans TaxID=1968433 RepID=A0A254TIX6_9BURK|nr:fatty acyl-CoA reductase [Noviherbaspirillum denitrificans]OWW22586.1 dehydrogenase [Noviherbaspirillum denitrificans]
MIRANNLSVQAALSGKRILLTGTTGFLAKVVLEKLIRSVPQVERIILLIRGNRNAATARERFEREIATSSIFDRLREEQPDYLAQFFTEKIECITGEITEPSFGLPAGRFIELAARVDLVINAAASVNFREPLDQALAINTLSLHYLTALTRVANAPLVQVSTCYVNGFNRGEMREQVVAPAGASIPRHHDGYYEVDALITRLLQKVEKLKEAVRDARQCERRLTELGIAEARRHGWNDTYTFTKWLGEQLAMRGMAGRALTILRPSIIESTLQEPAPGWLEGVKVADAVILAYARGKTSFFPARSEGIIDIIPADLVANGILLSAAEALAAPPGHRIYQCCSGAVNPVTMGEVIRLIQDESKRNWRKYDRLFHQEPTHTFRVVGNTTFRLGMGAVRAGVGAWSMLRRATGAPGESKAMEKMRTTQTLAVTFSVYSQPRYRFHSKNLLALAKRFRPYDKILFPVDARLVNWPDYLCRIHMAGLNRYALWKRNAKPVEPIAQTATLPAAEAVR